MLLWHSDLFQPLSWTELDLLWEAWEYCCFYPVSLTLLLCPVRKENRCTVAIALFLWHPLALWSLFSKQASPSSPFLFPRLCWTLIFKTRLRIMHTVFIHQILPSKNWFWPLMLHETTKPDLQFNLKILWVKKKPHQTNLLFVSCKMWKHRKLPLTPWILLLDWLIWNGHSSTVVRFLVCMQLWWDFNEPQVLHLLLAQPLVGRMQRLVPVLHRKPRPTNVWASSNCFLFCSSKGCSGLFPLARRRFGL